MNDKTTIPEFNFVLKSSTFATCLELLRQPLLHLSDIDIPKPVFNTWKKSGLINFQKSTDRRLWNLFSLLDYIILKIIFRLWNNDVDVEKIKSSLKRLLDGIYNIDLTNQNFEDNPNLDLMHYIVSQRKLNPHLPYFTTIEAYIIGALKLDRPFSIILYEDGKIEMFTTDSFTDITDISLKEKFSKTFLNVSIKDIVDKICSRENSVSSNNFIEKLIVKGYSVETISELFGDIK
jgi:hypothetical protein